MEMRNERVEVFEFTLYMRFKGWCVLFMCVHCVSVLCHSLCVDSSIFGVISLFEQYNSRLTLAALRHERGENRSLSPTEDQSFPSSQKSNSSDGEARETEGESGRKSGRDEVRYAFVRIGLYECVSLRETQRDGESEGEARWALATLFHQLQPSLSSFSPSLVEKQRVCTSFSEGAFFVSLSN